MVCEKPGQGSLATAWGTPEDHRLQSLCLKRDADGAPRAEETSVTHDLVECPGAEPISEGRTHAGT